ncbi:SRPBCC family protein [Paenibacillus woosongensis]|uniref:SRPBCC family protein n=2 Tax=Paenibacillus woosongensis TaxID=307580 RepID=A0AA95I017_9BACL|nr:SRPBCC family protein [Paenibacillus woosongensis]WHX47241.1 SRPBCC family protein [Paenibacillus woosongensis]
MHMKEAPVVRTGMLIRRPVEEVFEAIADPSITTKFWFTKSSGRLEAGKRIRWEWEMYGVGTDVDVLEIEANRRILLNWSPPDIQSVEMVFTPFSDSETYLSVTNSGFKGDGDQAVQDALDAMGGFTMVLCALKALLEHGIVRTIAESRLCGHIADFQ